MKTLNKSLMLLILLVSFFSCDDILEEDITNDSVQIIQPLEGYVNDGNTVQFAWQVVDGADNYRIQIINESQVLQIDSLITTNSLGVVLNSGNYKWQVRGENFAYTTSYILPINFSVQTSENLNNQSVVLLTPSDNLYSNNPGYTFTWEGVETADSYTFELVKNLNGEQTVLLEPNILLTSYAVASDEFVDDAEYIWKVKAVNVTSETIYSERSIFLDRVQPNQPSLTSPTDASTATAKTVTFNWTNGIDLGNIKSPITNTIEFSLDANFNYIIDSKDTGTNVLQYTFDSAGTYYWRVLAKDAASNESDPSIPWSIVVE